MCVLCIAFAVLVVDDVDDVVVVIRGLGFCNQFWCKLPKTIIVLIIVIVIVEVFAKKSCPRIEFLHSNITEQWTKQSQ